MPQGLFSGKMTFFCPTMKFPENMGIAEVLQQDIAEFRTFFQPMASTNRRSALDIHSERPRLTTENPGFAAQYE